MAATCVALGLVSFRLAGATRSAGVSSGGSRWPLSASPSTGDWRASCLASPASGQDLGAIFDVLGGSERVWGGCFLYARCVDSPRALLSPPGVALQGGSCVSLPQGTPDCGSCGCPHLGVSGQVRAAGHTSRQHVTCVYIHSLWSPHYQLCPPGSEVRTPAYSKGPRGCGPIPTMPMSPPSPQDPGSYL